jgi:hypothetical protein
MYAFAILTWEVLAQKKPFDGISSDQELGASLINGIRPPITVLSSDVQFELREMIIDGWMG